MFLPHEHGTQHARRAGAAAQAGPRKAAPAALPGKPMPLKIAADAGTVVEPSMTHVTSCDLPTPWATFRLHAFVETDGGKEHLALALGDFDDGAPVLARLHSDDASASKGGDLGWVNPGDTVPEFEKAMDVLQPNQISAPIQSPFGWHIIQVLERRTQDVTQERQKLVARQAIRERKSEEAFQDWVRQIRDAAYVELRPLD